MTDEETKAQLALLDEAGRVHRLASDTEESAAIAMRARARSQRERVLLALRNAGTVGLTDDEGAELLGWGNDRLKFGRRRQELRQVQLVEDSGQRRPSAAGNPAIVWRAV